MGKSSSEQQFRKYDGITFAVLNFWSRTPAQPGLTLGRQAGWLAGRRNPCDCQNFQNSL